MSTRICRLLLLLALPTSAFAAVYVVPPDAALIHQADAIVVGTVLDGWSHTDDAGEIVTSTILSPEEVLKGPIAPRSPLMMREAGGFLQDRAVVVSGVPLYWAGQRVLVFLEHHERGWWVTYGMSLGRFMFATSDVGQSILLRTAGRDEIHGWDTKGNQHRERARSAPLFLRYIRRVLAGEPVTDDYFLERTDRPIERIRSASDNPFSERTLREDGAPMEAPIRVFSHYPPSAYCMSGPFRWDVFDKGGSVTFRTSGTQPGYDSEGAARRGVAAWTNEPNSNVNYQITGTTTAGFVEDKQNAIVFNATSGVPAGAIATAKIYADATHPYKGETFYSIAEGDVIVKSGLTISQAAFDEAITHELGHTLGFRHSNEGTPGTSDAVMNAVVSGRYGASLAPWDVEAVTHVYGSGSVGGSGDKGDFNNDSKPDLVWRHYSSGQNSVWYMNGTAYSSGAALPSLADLNWRLEAVGDFNHDGRSDLVWRNYATGDNRVWFMNGVAFVGGGNLPTLADTTWRIEGVGDFNGDGHSDLVWRNYATGRNTVWYLNGTTYTGGAELPSLADLNWRLEGVADFNGDTRPDLVWRNYVTGANSVWYLSDASYLSGASLPPLGDTTWRIDSVADFSGDGRPDLVWRHYSSGSVRIWIMNGTAYSSGSILPTVSDLTWEIAGPR